MNVEPHHVAWFAALVAVLAVVGCSVLGLRSWRAWRRLSRTREAAGALVDLHSARLETLADDASVRAAALSEGGERITASIGELRADVAHLRWLLDRIPQERTRLRRTLLDIVLPTRNSTRA